jgi:hypothetical protein
VPVTLSPQGKVDIVIAGVRTNATQIPIGALIVECAGLSPAALPYHSLYSAANLQDRSRGSHGFGVAAGQAQIVGLAASDPERLLRDRERVSRDTEAARESSED